MPAPKTDPTGITFHLTVNTREITKDAQAGLDKGLNRAAIKWHGAAREATPVDTGRLRSSVTFSTPTVHARVRVAAGAGKGERAYTYTPPDPPPNTLLVGTNIEYALAVHEGITDPGGPEQVREHQVKAHKRRITMAFGRPITPRTIQVRTYTVRAHTRQRPPTTRAPRKFIEEPGRRLLPEMQRMITESIDEALGG